MKLIGRQEEAREQVPSPKSDQYPRLRVGLDACMSFLPKASYISYAAQLPLDAR